MAQAAADFNTFLEESPASLPRDEAVLIPLYEAYRAAGEAMHAIFNMPRCAGAASDILEDDMERMNDHVCAVAVKLSHLSSVKSFWKDLYVESMVSHAFFIGDDPLQALAKASAVRVIEDTKH